MGAPKQKWTAEEESALKAGVVKHGSGKWRTILKDPEFSSILCLRSNVDLKDKWRNLSVMANGWGSREKTRMVLKKSQPSLRHDDNPLALATIEENLDEEIVDVKPLAISTEPLHLTAPKKSFSRLDNLILEAITSLKEPTGSNKTAILLYIEAPLVMQCTRDSSVETEDPWSFRVYKDNYWPPPDFKRLLSAKLRALTSIGKLIKVKRKYKIAPSSSLSDGRSTKMILQQERQQEPFQSEREDFKPLMKSQVDAELAHMRNMTAEEAAAFAAQAVAEAEVAMAEAEKAAREAEVAEADAEAAEAFAEVAMLTLKNRTAVKMMVQV